MDASDKIYEPTEKEVILLGLVAEEPIHAYGLEEKIRSRKMDVWTSIGFSSIYRILARLEENGLIDTHLEHEGQGATRKVHAINARGSQVLATGVLAHLGQVVPVKSPFSVGLANITRAPLGEVQQQLAVRQHNLDRNHRELEEMEQGLLEMIAGLPPEAASDQARARLTVQLVLSCARAHIDAERHFVSEAIEKLESEDATVFGPDAQNRTKQEVP